MNIKERIERLEKENRNLKRFGGGIALLLFVASSVGFMQAEKEVADIIQAKRFQLIDDRGAVVSDWRIRIDSDGLEVPELSFAAHGEYLGSSSLNSQGVFCDGESANAYLSSSGMGSSADDGSWGTWLSSSGLYCSQSQNGDAVAFLSAKDDAYLYLRDTQGNRRRITATSLQSTAQVELPRPPSTSRPPLEKGR